MISINPKRVFWLLVTVIVGLLFLHGLAEVLILHLDHDRSEGFPRFFNMGREQNVPTFFSTLVLLLCAALLAAIASLRKAEGAPYWRYWALLGLIFLFMSMDEAVGFHERASRRIRDAVGVSGYLYYAWVIPYGAMALALLAGYLRFLRQLPQTTRRLFLASGGLYCLGALGLEMLAANEYVAHGLQTVTFAALETIEELLELAAVALFVYALLAYIGAEWQLIRIKVASSEHSNGRRSPPARAVLSSCGGSGS